MNSLVDEIHFLFSGRGMPYEKVALMVASVITVFFTVFLGYNYARDVNVAVVDLDHSRYSQEMVEAINSSRHMKVSSVIYTPSDPQKFFYEDKAYAVICLPKDLERDVYSGQSVNIGLYCDYTNVALTADIQTAMNELAGTINAEAAEDKGESGGISISTRLLFNPSGSTSNAETEGFLFFFSSMFFTFATIGMVPRLKLEHKWEALMDHGSPFDLMVRILPYMGCLFTALLLGMAILRVWGDMVISGNMFLFMALQFFYIWGVGMMSILFGWTAANPGVASSRMILFIPGGFILGGQAGPLIFIPEWVKILSHFFPLTWEFHFVRDIIMRGAGFSDIMQEIGAFFLYLAAIAIVFCLRFESVRRRYRAAVAEKEEAQESILP